MAKNTYIETSVIITRTPLYTNEVTKDIEYYSQKRTYKTKTGFNATIKTKGNNNSIKRELQKAGYKAIEFITIFTTPQRS